MGGMQRPHKRGGRGGGGALRGIPGQGSGQMVAALTSRELAGLQLNARSSRFPAHPRYLSCEPIMIISRNAGIGNLAVTWK